MVRNRAKASEKQFRRRARLRSSTLPEDWASKRDVADVLLGSGSCGLCGVGLSLEDRVIDHVVPVVIGGSHSLWNLRVLCAPCNGARPWDGSDLPAGWLDELGITGEKIHANAAEYQRFMADKKEEERALREARRREYREARLRRTNTRRDLARLRADEALRLRLEESMKWVDVAATLGYARDSSAFNAAHQSAKRQGISFKTRPYERRS